MSEQEPSYVPYYSEPSLHGFNFVLQEYLKFEKDSKNSTSRLLDDYSV